MKYQALANILSTEYGVGPAIAPVEAVLWAAEKLPVSQAKQELRELNAMRQRQGRPLVYVPYGHPLF